MSVMRKLRIQKAKRWVRRRDKLDRAEKRSLACRKIDGTIEAEQESNILSYYGADVTGNSFYFKIIHKKDDRAELTLFLTLSDGRTYELPDHPNTVLDKISHNEWSIGDLKFSILEESVRSRILYNGILRRGIRKDVSDNSDENLEHIRFNFIFIAKTEPYLQDDYWNIDLKVNALINRSQRSSNWHEFWSQICLDNVHQWGSMLGEIIFENAEITEVFLHGIRQYEWGIIEERSLLEKSVLITGFCMNGIYLHIVFNDLGNGLQEVQLGHIKTGYDDFHGISHIEIDSIEAIDFNQYKCTDFSLKFTASKRTYSLHISFQENLKRILYGGYPWNSECQYCNIEILLNDKFKGMGLFQSWQPYNNTVPILLREIKFPRRTSFTDNTHKKECFTVPFNSELCLREKLVGGKGSSLAKLTSIQTEKFMVPKGFCITVNAFNQHMKYHSKLNESIDNLVESYYHLIPEKLQSSCEEIRNMIRKTEIVEEVKIEIFEAIRHLKSIICSTESGKDIRFAIRSSAVGEDSEETSAAGQNETFLGIQNEWDILKYIAHCWASLYSFRSIEYRRQQGLPIKALMGVCVQEMIDAESAGVMFTRHPLNGNPKEIFITSNYGLGESVVSALAEPDTIIIRRDWKNGLQMKERSVGRKNKIIILCPDGTKPSTVSEEKRKNVSITEEMSLRLGQIGVKIEILFHGPKDIEWAVKDDTIFLLQSRPITSMNNFTEFELTHELGTGVPTELDTFIFSNVGEVLPYPLSPLSLSSTSSILNCATEYYLTDNLTSRTFKNYFCITYMRCHFNYINTFLLFVDKELKLTNKLADISLCGHIIVNDEIFQMALDRFGSTSFSRMLRVLTKMSRECWRVDKSIEKTQKLVMEMWRQADRNSALSSSEIYNSINQTFPDYMKACVCHSEASRACSLYEILIIAVLMEGAKDFTSEHWVDIGAILRSCSDVISAQIPIKIREISQCIKQSEFGEEFKNLESLRMEWLQKHCPIAYDKINNFLKIYGHRGVMEFDVMTETWGMNPEKLLSTIQFIVQSSKSENFEVKHDELDENVVDKLISPRKASTRWILKKLMPICQKSVKNRETTKSLLIESIHIFRTNYNLLAKSLVKDGLLPDEKLIFFLTHEEIQILLQQPNCTLIRKAYQRRKLYPKLKRNQFKEVYQGMPKPEQSSNEIPLTKYYDKVVKGTVVYNGKVVGRACVINNVEDATSIKSGDILVTNATDIGWSPYFPLLSGIVTELGGLISHGAVVAREYGLPCIIGAVDATKLFHTGDMVSLDGHSGTLELVENVETNPSGIPKS